MGALKGVILDADGSVLHNLYSDFEIGPKSVNFALATETTNVRNKCVEVSAHIEANLRGEFMTGVRCLCSPEFFEKLVGHAKVEKAYENYAQGAMLLDDVPLFDRALDAIVERLKTSVGHGTDGAAAEPT